MPDRNVTSKLKQEHVIWLATAGRAGRPHAVPVWFLWDGESLLVYSVPGQKIEDIKANPKVQLHFNTDFAGSDVVRIDGTATIVRDDPGALKNHSYLRKYGPDIKSLGLTNNEFAGQYDIAIRIRPTRFH